MKKSWLWIKRAAAMAVMLGMAFVPEARGEDWTYEAYTRAVQESGRSMDISQKTFDKVQGKREKALEAIEKYLTSRFGAADPEVLRAFREVPREYFHHNYQSGRGMASVAYEIPAKPWGIGYGSALSDYLGQAYMTQLAGVKSSDVVLEIGTGSGFQISLFSRIAREVYSIEIIEPLGEGVGKIFAPLGYANVHTRVGDGYFGWPEVEEGFDVIMLTCAAQYASPELLKQLKPGGKLIIPIGQPFKKGQFLYVFTKDAEGKVHSKKDMGVYFIPMTGEIQKHKQEKK
ncbi:MAG: Protein-L-isoaspartate O-methyltransferase [Synergistetes bacterium ADurb.Bin520]|nr:MAG: Protein-L-isoaspartate O-methyltransferase [Synergistetes bacterium ADurb.Bin520]